MSNISLAEHAQIKSTFIFSQIFETPEDTAKNPFEFRMDPHEHKLPGDFESPTITGYLLHRTVSYPILTNAPLVHTQAPIKSPELTILWLL